jgi:hypothetical protein
VFSVASGYALDNETGNYVPVATGVTFYATLKQKNNPRYDTSLEVV